MTTNQAEKKTLTMLQFEKACGGPMAAALQAGVDLSTWGRWTAKKNAPRGNNARRLRELGVSW